MSPMTFLIKSLQTEICKLIKDRSFILLLSDISAVSQKRWKSKLENTILFFKVSLFGIDLEMVKEINFPYRKIEVLVFSQRNLK